MVAQLEQLLEQRGRQRELTVKWKVAADPDPQEWSLLETLLERLPSTASCGWMPMGVGTEPRPAVGWNGWWGIPLRLAGAAPGAQRSRGIG